MSTDCTSRETSPVIWSSSEMIDGAEPELNVSVCTPPMVGVLNTSACISIAWMRPVSGVNVMLPGSPCTVVIVIVPSAPGVICRTCSTERPGSLRADTVSTNSVLAGASKTGPTTPGSAVSPSKRMASAANSVGFEMARLLVELPSSRPDARIVSSCAPSTAANEVEFTLPATVSTFTASPSVTIAPGSARRSVETRRLAVSKLVTPSMTSTFLISALASCELNSRIAMPVIDSA
mmetsp:Transcript_2439/g.6367  ORF Transcript_2439/g.6367 Transcript_2439/m.6367 type:complete len:235 (-) Transcript_2439:107-811(-)